MEKLERDLVVLGGGPGGYTAAFRAADLGRSVTLVEKESSLGGVCLNVGCIPSKSLLHVVEVMSEAAALTEAGVVFTEPSVDLKKVRTHKEKIVSSLTGGLEQLCKARKIEIVRGAGKLLNNTTLEVITDEKSQEITFKDLIIAVGSRSVQIPNIPYEDQRVWDSTKALELSTIPKHLLIIGGGIIGLEMAEIYHGLGSDITIVEMMDSIIPAADADLKQPLFKRIKKEYKNIFTSTKVTEVEATKEHLVAHLQTNEKKMEITADAILVAVGRKANSDQISIENTSIKLKERGWIETNEKQQTAVDNIYAIGDVTGDPMLAHRATHQGKVAAEVACALHSAFTPLAIPSVAYTRPEIAWVGVTEEEAKREGILYKKGSFPWQASGRALSSMAGDGVSKVLFDEKTERLIGVGISGKNAGELIGEAILALEMGSVAPDISLSIHPHPTLSETFAVATELSEKKATDMLNK